MDRHLRRVAAWCVCALLVTACGGATADLDGSYRAFAAADAEVPDLTLEVDGDRLRFAGPDGTTEATLGEVAGTYPVCGTNRADDVIGLGSAITVGGVDYADPAVVADCGITAPVRVTLVDLDSHDASLGVVPFIRWVELCDLADPDC